MQEKKRLRAMRENCAGFDKSQSIPNILILIQKLVSAAQKPGERA